MTWSIKSPVARFGLALGATICVLSAPVSGYFLARIFLEACDSSTWPRVEGQLMKVRVGERAGRYYPDVSYTYEVDGKIYTGSRIRASDGECDFRDGAAQEILGLAEGQHVVVYYRPDNPKVSVLRTGARLQEYALLAVPIAMLGLGCFGFLRLWRTWRVR